MDHYNIDSVGWGTPFLLVPEATNVDETTKKKLLGAKEKDLYLSNISPLGVPFNTLRGNTKDIEKMANVAKGKPGSSCPKQYLVSNTEYTDKAICTAASRFQKKKLNELEENDKFSKDYQNKFDKVVDKACLCVGLGTSVLENNKIDQRVEGKGVSICPGPNMAYFSKLMSLREITDHIYGRFNVMTRKDRPNMFVKELNIYIEYLSNKIDEAKETMSEKQEKYFTSFAENLLAGVSYYNELFDGAKGKFEGTKEQILTDLDRSAISIKLLMTRLNNKKLSPVLAN